MTWTVSSKCIMPDYLINIKYKYCTWPNKNCLGKISEMSYTVLEMSWNLFFKKQWPPCFISFMIPFLLIQLKTHVSKDISSLIWLIVYPNWPIKDLRFSCRNLPNSCFFSFKFRNFFSIDSFDFVDMTYLI